MARKRKKTQAVRTTDGLEPPFAACPSRPPKYGFYLYRAREGKVQSLGYFNFYAKYAAKKFIETCLGDREYKWVDKVSKIVKGSGETVKDLDGLIIDGRGLEEIIDYEYKNEAERNWNIPVGCTWVQMAAMGLKEPVPRQSEQPRVEEPKKEKKPRREKKEKIDKSGLTTVKDIADTLGISPSDCRSVLRKAKIEKPEAGWCWPEDEVDGITKTIQGGL